MQTFTAKIDQLVDAGWNVENYHQYVLWFGRVRTFLHAAIDNEAAESFASASSDQDNQWEDDRGRQIGHLEGLALRIEARGIQASRHSVEVGVQSQGSVEALTRVFLVHGHDSGAKETTARFLERIGLVPIVLHEQPNEGRTIIEKFEAFADVGFAVALLTPDDVGAVSDDPDKLAPRARQNVVLELGYFTGKLGRKRVCALYIHGVEVPSDLHGVLFIEFDANGAWKAKLAQELVQAGMQIRLQGLLGS